MVISLYTADVKLNKSSRAHFNKYLIINNPDSGILFVNRGLFSLSFESEEALLNSDVKIKNKKHIGDITL